MGMILCCANSDMGLKQVGKLLVARLTCKGLKGQCYNGYIQVYTQWLVGGQINNVKSKSL